MLSVNYGFVADKQKAQSIPCYCLAPNCTGNLYATKAEARVPHNTQFQLIGPKSGINTKIYILNDLLGNVNPNISWHPSCVSPNFSASIIVGAYVL